MLKSQQAREFAIKAHGDQRYGNRPYVWHLDHVAAIVAGQLTAECRDDDELLCAAYLHDVLEDTKVRREDIEAEFGERVSDLVWCVTGHGKNREERWQDALRKIKLYGRDAIILKVADRTANASAAQVEQSPLLNMYEEEMDVFVDELRNYEDTPLKGLWKRLTMAHRK